MNMKSVRPCESSFGESKKKRTLSDTKLEVTIYSSVNTHRTENNKLMSLRNNMVYLNVF